LSPPTPYSWPSIRARIASRYSGSPATTLSTRVYSVRLIRHRVNKRDTKGYVRLLLWSKLDNKTLEKGLLIWSLTFNILVMRVLRWLGWPRKSRLQSWAPSRSGWSHGLPYLSSPPDDPVLSVAWRKYGTCSEAAVPLVLVGWACVPVPIRIVVLGGAQPPPS
jgi:hypothetical protein